MKTRQLKCANLGHVLAENEGSSVVLTVLVFEMHATQLTEILLF